MSWDQLILLAGVLVSAAAGIGLPAMRLLRQQRDETARVGQRLEGVAGNVVTVRDDLRRDEQRTLEHEARLGRVEVTVEHQGSRLERVERIDRDAQRARTLAGRPHREQQGGGEHG